MTPRPIALLTDFGDCDPYAGICRAVIAGIDPTIPLIDITHGVARQDVAAGALALADAAPYLPEACVVLGVVDPGVGGPRRAVAVQAGDGCHFVGPDNGLLTQAIDLRGGATRACEISATSWRLTPVSRTFHGRDIFAPVAARLACGEPLERAGSELDPASLLRLPSTVTELSEGVVTTGVVAIDSYGNVQLAARTDDLRALGGGAEILIKTGELSRVAAMAAAYGEGENDSLLLMEDSTGALSLAINGGDAAAALGLASGDRVRLVRR